MIMKNNFCLLDEAVIHYERLGYKYIEVPWIVSNEAYDITCKVENNISNNDYNFIASAEQGFLELIINKNLKEDSYCGVSPCYRPFDQKNRFYYNQFYKLELFRYLGVNCSNYSKLLELLEDMELEVFDLYVSLGIKREKLFTLKDKDVPRKGCITVYSYEIYADITDEKVELGSYGLRYNPNVGYWIYGTGLALPRFTEVLKHI